MNNIKNCISTILLISMSIVQANDLEIFTNSLASSLQANVTDAQIATIKDSQLKELAKELQAKNYDTTYRLAEYKAVLNPDTLGKQLSIGDGYSRYQGVTGIILEKGVNTVIVEGLAEGQEASILVPNWMRFPEDETNPTEDKNGWGLHKKTYPIKNGINKLNIEQEGLAYVSYFSEKPAETSPIKVHFVDGKVNGYFDSNKQNNADWDKLLANAKYPIMDAIGKYIQVAYPVKDFQKYTAGKGVELINNYDVMLKLQYDIMGLTKYNRIPDNKILARVNFNYYMFRDSDGVAYMGGKQSNAMGMVADPERVIKGDPCWGFSHEVGHVHQLRPEFNWGGLGEVSNNIFSLYNNITLGTPSRLKECGAYNRARETVIGKEMSYIEHDDVFVRLAPFWQLHLYFNQQGNKDFYPDLFELLRQQSKGNSAGGWGSARGNNPAVYQLNFVKQACIAGKTDLTEFFDKWGFFKVGEWEVQDYGSHKYVMTAEMSEACKKEIAKLKLPKPAFDPTSCEDIK